MQKTCLFMELKAFSTSKTASVSFVANMSCFECTAASHYASFPLYNCISKDGYYSGTWFRWYKYVWWNQRWPSGDRICNCQILLMLIFFLRSLVCNPDLQDPPLVFIVAFSLILYYIIKNVGWITCGFSLISVFSQAGCGWGCSCCKVLSVFAISFKWCVARFGIICAI